MTFRTLPERLDIGYTVICVKPMGPNPKQRMRHLSAVHYLLSRGSTYCVLVLSQCVEAKCVGIGGGLVGKREAQEVWVGCSDGEKIQNISKSCILDPSTFSKLRCCIIFTFFPILLNTTHPMCIITQLNFNGKFLYSSCCCESLTMPI